MLDHINELKIKWKYKTMLYSKCSWLVRKGWGVPSVLCVNMGGNNTAQNVCFRLFVQTYLFHLILLLHKITPIYYQVRKKAGNSLRKYSFFYKNSAKEALRNHISQDPWFSNDGRLGDHGWCHMNIEPFSTSLAIYYTKSTPLPSVYYR